MAPSMKNAEEAALQGIVIPAHDEQVVPTPVLLEVMPTEANLKHRALKERGVCGYDRRSPRSVVRTVVQREGLTWHCRPSVQQVRVVAKATHGYLEGLEGSFSHGRVAVEGFELFRADAAPRVRLRIFIHRRIPKFGILEAHQVNGPSREQAPHALSNRQFVTCGEREGKGAVVSTCMPIATASSLPSTSTLT